MEYLWQLGTGTHGEKHRNEDKTRVGNFPAAGIEMPTQPDASMAQGSSVPTGLSLCSGEQGGEGLVPLSGSAGAPGDPFLSLWRHLNPELGSFILPAALQSRVKNKTVREQTPLASPAQGLSENFPQEEKSGS